MPIDDPSSSVSPSLPVSPAERVPSAEDIAGSVRAAFDSVHLCNNIINGNVNIPNAINNVTENKATVERNKAHLQIMLGKTWFTEALTEQQRSEIDACITASEAFIA
jgi:hypothetical protein